MLVWVFDITNRETGDSEDDACASTVRNPVVAGACLCVMGNMADTPVHVARGAQHCISQPPVHLVVAMDQLM